MRIDLHCHSKYSKRPSLWLMQKLGCPESFTEPHMLYDLAIRRGMTGVTITDHNVIDGALEIADLPNTIVGCEYTTYFPQDGCKVHILVYGQNEAQHEDLSKVRENIFDLVAYCNEKRLKQICAHPIYMVNDRLTLSHIEQLVLLYKIGNGTARFSAIPTTSCIG
jgi:predicted metal-dependent phosphoesterase TrpH